MSNPEVLQRKHTRREFRERMQSGELKACIIPVAAIEQHLEHLAMEHDWRSVCHVAVAVAERLRPHALVAEGLMAGVSEHHMRHSGTWSMRPGTFLAVLADLIDRVVRFQKRAGPQWSWWQHAPVNGTGQFADESRQLPFSFTDVLTEADARRYQRFTTYRMICPATRRNLKRPCACRLSRERSHENVDGSGDKKPSLATAEQGKKKSSSASWNG